MAYASKLNEMLDVLFPYRALPIAEFFGCLCASLCIRYFFKSVTCFTVRSISSIAVAKLFKGQNFPTYRTGVCGLIIHDLFGIGF